METIIRYWGIYNGDDGKENGNYFSILGLYIYIYQGDNGKENGNIVVYWGYIIGILEKKMETIIVYLGLYNEDKGKDNGNGCQA